MKFYRYLCAILITGAISTYFGPSAHAGDGVWTGVPTSGYSAYWSEAATWENGNIANGVDATATFRPDTSYIRCVVDTPVTLGHLSFEKTKSYNHYVVEDDPWRRMYLETTSGTPSITTDRSVVADFYLPLGGTQGLDKFGDGTLDFGSGEGNSFTGAMNIHAGSVEVWSNNSLGATGAGNGTIVHSGSNLTIGDEVSVAEDVTLSGTGSDNDSGALRLYGKAELTGSLTLNGNATITQDSYWDVVAGKITGPISLPNEADVTFEMYREYNANDYTAETFRTSVSGNISGTGGVIATGEGTLTLSGTNTYSGGTTVKNEAVLSVSSPASLGAASNSVVLDNGTLQITGTTYKGTNREIEILSGGGGIDIDHSSNTFVIPTSLSGTGDLVKKGDGTLSLTAGNEGFTGDFIVNEGTLAVGINNSVGSQTGITVKSGAKLALEGPEDIGSLAGDSGALVEIRQHNLRFGSDNTDTRYRGRITGTAMVKKFGTGTQTLSGDLEYTGDTEVQTGRLILDGDNQAMTGDILVKSGATLRAAQGNAISSVSRINMEAGANFNILEDENIGSLAGDGTINTNIFDSVASRLGVGEDNSSSTFSGTIIGNGGQLNKLGTGTFTLTGNNTYTGKTTISDGTLALSGANIIAGNAIEVKNGATLRTDHLNSLSSSANINIASGGTVDMPAGGEFESFTGTGTIDGHKQSLIVGAENSSFTFDGTLINGNITKRGSGTFTIDCQRQEEFDATVEAGTLRFERWGTGSFGTIAIQNGGRVESIYEGIGENTDIEIAAGGTLAIEATVTVGSLSGAGSVILPQQTPPPFGIDPLPHAESGLNLYSADFAKTTTFSGVISGEGFLGKQGSHTLILDSANTYTGGTILYYGLLVADHDQAFGTGGIFFDNGELQINEGVTITNNIDFTYYQSSGILCGKGTLQSDLVSNVGAYITPGYHSLDYEESAIGVLTIDGNYTQGDGGLFMELSGAESGEYDRLVITGTADLGGVLFVELLNDFTSEMGDSFDILDWGSFASGSSFDYISFPSLDDELQWNTSRLYSDGIISVVPEPTSLAVLMLGFAGLVRRRFGRTAS